MCKSPDAEFLRRREDCWSIPSIDSHIWIRQSTVFLTKSVSKSFKTSKWHRTSSSFSWNDALWRNFTKLRDLTLSWVWPFGWKSSSWLKAFVNLMLRFVFSERTGIELVKIEMAILVGNWLAAIADAVRSAKISDITSGIIFVKCLTKWPDWLVSLVRKVVNSNSVSKAPLSCSFWSSLMCSKLSRTAKSRSSRGRASWRNSGVTCSRWSALKSIALTTLVRAITSEFVKIGTFFTSSKFKNHSTSSWQFERVRIASFWQFFGLYQQACRAAPRDSINCAVLHVRWKLIADFSANLAAPRTSSSIICNRLEWWNNCHTSIRSSGYSLILYNSWKATNLFILSTYTDNK